MVARPRACDDGAEMTTVSQSSSRSPAGVRRAHRDTGSSVIGGVAAGLAAHLGLPVLGVRAFFVVAAALGGFGVALYAGLWMFLPAAPPLERGTPGAESASRGGLRPRRITRLADAGPVIALLALGFGALIVVESLIGQGAVFWAVVLAVVGIALLWRQADEAQRERWVDTTARINLARLVFGRGGWQAYVRVGIGALLMISAAFVIGVDNGSMMSDGWGALVFVVLLLGAGFIVVGPLMHRLATDLSAEREERVRNQERADMAAHLHDSVLQTLALIQRNAQDPGTVTRLARAQERDLRSWLYDSPASAEENLSAALKAAAAEVEDAHGVSVDVVVVGEAPLGDAGNGVRHVVAAAREAITNAAKHAGTGRVDVYAEVTGDDSDDGGEIAVFVRDRGAGFDVDDIPHDRHGVRGSIVQRMERHGGRAEVRSAPGQGTEVRLFQPRPQTREDRG